LTGLFTSHNGAGWSASHLLPFAASKLCIFAYALACVLSEQIKRRMRQNQEKSTSKSEPFLSEISNCVRMPKYSDSHSHLSVFARECVWTRRKREKRERARMMQSCRYAFLSTLIGCMSQHVDQHALKHIKTCIPAQNNMQMCTHTCVVKTSDAPSHTIVDCRKEIRVLRLKVKSSSSPRKSNGSRTCSRAPYDCES